MSRQAGFSLIEVMVALTIMALAAGAVVMTVGSPGGSLATQTDRLIASLVAARDNALTANRMVSVEIGEGGYQTIVHSQVSFPRVMPFQAWADGVSVTTDHGAASVMITFDPVGLAQGAQVALTRGGMTDGIVVLASGEIRRQDDAP
jgi:general secretion pathway protein H